MTPRRDRGGRQRRHVEGAQPARADARPTRSRATALACLEAGAAIVHSHIDDFALTGEAAAARYLEAWRPIVAARPDAILYSDRRARRLGRRALRARAAARGVRAHAHGRPRSRLREPRLAPATTACPGGFDFVYSHSYGDVRYVVAQLARASRSARRSRSSSRASCGRRSSTIGAGGCRAARSSSSTSAATRATWATARRAA